MFPFSNFSVQTCKRILQLPLERQKFEPNFLARDLWAASPRPGNRLWWAQRSSRPAEDVALRLISYSRSSVNNCCAVGNNAVHVEHRRSGSDRRSIKFPSRTASLSALSVGSLQVILHSICMEQRANNLNSLIFLLLCHVWGLWWCPVIHNEEIRHRDRRLNERASPHELWFPVFWGFMRIIEKLLSNTGRAVLGTSWPRMEFHRNCLVHVSSPVSACVLSPLNRENGGHALGKALHLSEREGFLVFILWNCLFWVFF